LTESSAVGFDCAIINENRPLEKQNKESKKHGQGDDDAFREERKFQENPRKTLKKGRESSTKGAGHI